MVEIIKTQATQGEGIQQKTPATEWVIILEYKWKRKIYISTSVSRPASKMIKSFNSPKLHKLRHHMIHLRLLPPTARPNRSKGDSRATVLYNYIRFVHFILLFGVGPGPSAAFCLVYLDKTRPHRQNTKMRTFLDQKIFDCHLSATKRAAMAWSQHLLPSSLYFLLINNVGRNPPEEESDNQSLVPETAGNPTTRDRIH